MIKGILSLFTSGAIFNPMVLIGIAFGTLLSVSLNGEQIFEIYKDYNIYLMALLIAFIYGYFFKRVYKLGGKEVDYSETSLLIFGAALKLLFSSVMMISFISFLFF